MSRREDCLPGFYGLFAEQDKRSRTERRPVPEADGGSGRAKGEAEIRGDRENHRFEDQYLPPWERKCGG